MYYTGEAYQCHVDDITYRYYAERFTSEEEIFSEEIQVEQGSETRFFFRGKDGWEEDVEQMQYGVNIFDFKRINPDWLMPLSSENDHLKDRFELQSKNDSIDEIYNLMFQSRYEEDISETSWGSFKLFVNLDGEGKIQSLFYVSFPSYEVTFVENDEIIELPGEIISQLNQ